MGLFAKMLVLYLTVVYLQPPMITRRRDAGRAVLHRCPASLSQLLLQLCKFLATTTIFCKASALGTALRLHSFTNSHRYCTLDDSNTTDRQHSAALCHTACYSSCAVSASLCGRFPCKLNPLASKPM